MNSPSRIDFSEGQIWAYKTRPAEENATVRINKVEDDSKFGKIFHISLENVKVKNPHCAEGFSTELSHFPVSKKTLEDSLTQLLGVGLPCSKYQEGYKVWKEAFDEGRAGIFTITVAEIIEFIENAMNKP